MDALLAGFLRSLTRDKFMDQDVVVATLNIALLNAPKLTLLIRYMALFRIDILCLQDVRLSSAQAAFMKKHAARLLGTGCVIKSTHR